MKKHRCNYCRKDTETNNRDCVVCGFRKTSHSMDTDKSTLNPFLVDLNKHGIPSIAHLENQLKNFLLPRLRQYENYLYADTTTGEGCKLCTVTICSACIITDKTLPTNCNDFETLRSFGGSMTDLRNTVAGFYKVHHQYYVGNDLVHAWYEELIKRANKNLLNYGSRLEIKNNRCGVAVVLGI